MHSPFTVQQIGHYSQLLWFALAAVWLGFAPLAKRAVYRQPPLSRLAHILPAGIGLWLLFSSAALHGEIEWINRPLFAVTLRIAYAGLVLVFCGIAFSIWARFTLDGNWSGSATLKQDHSLIRRGPYRITRHPIYAGLLLALLGSALERGLIRSFLAVLLCTVTFSLKLMVEEKLMVQRFGEEYLRYRREVPVLAPFRF